MLEACAELAIGARQFCVFGLVLSELLRQRRHQTFALQRQLLLQNLGGPYLHELLRRRICAHLANHIVGGDTRPGNGQRVGNLPQTLFKAAFQQIDLFGVPLLDAARDLRLDVCGFTSREDKLECCECDGSFREIL